jgi:hypothetical protein
MVKRSLPAALAIFVLVTLFGLGAQTFADGSRTAMCHATRSATNPFNFLTLPGEPLSAHFDEFGSPLAGHETDFFPVDNDCDTSNDPDGGDPPGPGAVPEPVTILLFGAGVAGVGYASRRVRRNRMAKAENEK